MQGAKRKQNKKKTRKKCKRNITWFNPPYSKIMKTNIGSFFYRSIKKHFQPKHKLHRIFNRNNLKLSYFCIPNLKSLINNHNQNMLQGQPQSTAKTCNCLKEEDCPINGLCLTESLLYCTTIICSKENYTKLCKGICELIFKKRYANHKKTF